MICTYYIPLSFHIKQNLLLIKYANSLRYFSHLPILLATNFLVYISLKFDMFWTKPSFVTIPFPPIINFDYSCLSAIKIYLDNS